MPGALLDSFARVMDGVGFAPESPYPHLLAWLDGEPDVGG